MCGWLGSRVGEAANPGASGVAPRSDFASQGGSDSHFPEQVGGELLDALDLTVTGCAGVESQAYV